VRSRLDGAPRMPRYFFHVIDGKEMLDTGRHRACGRSGRAGRSHRGLRRDAEDLGGTFWNHGEWQVRVEDEAGNKVLSRLR